jgi:hypothetical protein
MNLQKAEAAYKYRYCSRRGCSRPFPKAKSPAWCRANLGRVQKMLGKAKQAGAAEFASRRCPKSKRKYRGIERAIMKVYKRTAPQRTGVKAFRVVMDYERKESLFSGRWKQTAFVYVCGQIKSGPRKSQCQSMRLSFTRVSKDRRGRRWRKWEYYSISGGGQFMPCKNAR